MDTSILIDMLDQFPHTAIRSRPILLRATPSSTTLGTLRQTPVCPVFLELFRRACARTHMARTRNLARAQDIVANTLRRRNTEVFHGHPANGCFTETFHRNTCPIMVASYVSQSWQCHALELFRTAGRCFVFGFLGPCPHKNCAKKAKPSSCFSSDDR